MSKLNDLNELNTLLFETVRDVRSGKMDSEKVGSICKISSVILDGAKVQINAANALKGIKLESQFFGTNLDVAPKVKKLSNPEMSVYDRKLEFAMSLGFESLSAAIGELGKNTFEKQFKEDRKL